MSIHDSLNKIKGKTGLDQGAILNILIIILVGFSAFGLGRLSVESTEHAGSEDSGVSIIASSYTPLQNRAGSSNATLGEAREDTKERGKYVASKNGKLYYTLGCSGVKRIKEENKIYFDTAADAEKLGLKASPSCK